MDADGQGQAQIGGPARARRRRNLLSGALAAGGHVVLVLLLVQALPRPPSTSEPEATAVTLVPAAILFPPTPAPAKPDKPARRVKAAAPAPRRIASRPAPPRKPRPLPAPTVVAATQAPSRAPPVELSEAQLAGAITAGAGDGEDAGEGGGAAHCDMVRRVQDALRRDARVRLAVSGARPSRGALLLWNRGWIQSQGEEGKGLAGVRQAIALEVAFAPEACRARPVHGVVLLSMNDGARLALGGGAWRWSDLLEARR